MIGSTASPTTERASDSRARPRIRFAAWIILAAPGLVTCGKSGSFFVKPDTEPIEAMVHTAVPLAYAASAAMAVLQGHTPPRVDVLVPCVGSPCLFLLAVTVEPGSLPAELGQGGVILVAGLGLSDETAIITAAFLDTPAGTARFPVASLGTVPVVLDGAKITVVYADIDIDIGIPEDPLESLERLMLTPLEIERELERLDTPVAGELEVALEMDALVVSTDTMGTLLDLTDDSYTITGATQMLAVSSTPPAGVFQLAVVGARMIPSCPRNPVAGLAVVQDLGVRPASPLLIAQAVIAFRSKCNGEALVLVGTGNYLPSTGRPLELKLGGR